MQSAPLTNVVSLWPLFMPDPHTVMVNQPFTWDATSLQDRPPAEPPLWLIPVSAVRRDLPQAQQVQSWRSFAPVIRGISTATFGTQVIVTPHANALLRRCWHWLHKTEPDFPATPATSGFNQVMDFVEMLNWPAFLDLTDRRGWTPKRVACVFGNAPPELDTSVSCTTWPVVPTLQYLHQIATTFT